jgi:hypothetical protein
MATNSFDLVGFIGRLVAALVLVYATYNPSGYSYFHWVENNLPNFDPLVAFAGVILLIGWVMFIRATARSMGLLGVVLAAAFFGTLLWLIVDQGWLSMDNMQVTTYVAQFLLGAVLATGMSWSHIRRRLTGQVDVDDVEEVD